MPLLSISSGPPKSFGFAGGVAPITDALKFPKDSVVPFYGSNPGYGDWDRYADADGHCLYSATSNGQIGFKTAQANGGAVAAFSSSAGSHSGSAVQQNLSFATGSPFVAPAGSSGVTHSHSVSGSAYYIENNLINKQNITLLRANKPTRYLPLNSLVVKQTAATNSTAFTAASNTYLVGANNDLSTTVGVPANASAGAVVTSDSGHYHASGSSAYRTISYGAYFRNYNMSYGGEHTHTATLSFTQSAITSKLVNLWKLVQHSVPETDVIVMYVGDLSQLPVTWKLCDGNNNTPNLGGFIIGYANNQWNVITVANPAGALSISTAYPTHSHASGYARTINSGGPSALHSSFGWSHSHSGSCYIYEHSPPKIGVAFIQYKG